MQPNKLVWQRWGMDRQGGAVGHQSAFVSSQIDQQYECSWMPDSSKACMRYKPQLLPVCVCVCVCAREFVMLYSMSEKNVSLPLYTHTHTHTLFSLML